MNISFLLFYSPKPRCQVRILRYRNWSTLFYGRCNILVFFYVFVCLFKMLIVCNRIKVINDTETKQKHRPTLCDPGLFTILKNGVLQTQFFSHWITGHCQEVILAFGNCVSGEAKIRVYVLIACWDKKVPVIERSL